MLHKKKIIQSLHDSSVQAHPSRVDHFRCGGCDTMIVAADVRFDTPMPGTTTHDKCQVGPWVAPHYTGAEMAMAWCEGWHAAARYALTLLGEYDGSTT